MRKVHFKILFLLHKFYQFLGLKAKDDCVIKIWWDEKTQNTLLYANARSGLWHMPVGIKCEEGKGVYSYWLASITKTNEYGLDNNKKDRTIYTLIDVKERT